jgi:hypothetical protein
MQSSIILKTQEEIEMNIRALLKLLLLLLTSSILILRAWPANAQGAIDVTDVTTPAEDSPRVQSRPQATPARRGYVGRRYSQSDAAPEAGRDAASKYMGVSGSRRPAGTTAPRYLAIHIGPFISDSSYHWGHANKVNDAANWTAGMTYRLGGWDQSADFALRFDLSTYSLPEGHATKISVLPIVMFPDASSRFPLYFGAGAGLGIMAKQLPDESPLVLEYQIFGGVRFFELFGSTGLFLESGIKNHLSIFSDGQFNGIFMAAGAVFTF